MYDLQLLRYADRPELGAATPRPNLPASESYTKIAVQRFRAASFCFFASLYRNASSGCYHIIFSGKNELSTPVIAKGVLEAHEVTALWSSVLAKWHLEMSDALWFAFHALKQIRNELRPRVEREPSLEDLRALVYVSGHSIGGALAELVSQFFGLKGFNIDGPGVQALTQHREFASLKVMVRKEFPDLQPRYEFQAGDFVANSYSVIGLAGTHADGVSYDGPMELGAFARKLAGLGDDDLE
jgi:hypothetical protein